MLGVLARFRFGVFQETRRSLVERTRLTENVAGVHSAEFLLGEAATRSSIRKYCTEGVACKRMTVFGGIGGGRAERGQDFSESRVFPENKAALAMVDALAVECIPGVYLLFICDRDWAILELLQAVERPNFDEGAYEERSRLWVLVSYRS